MNKLTDRELVDLIERHIKVRGFYNDGLKQYQTFLYNQDLYRLVDYLMFLYIHRGGITIIKKSLDSMLHYSVHGTVMGLYSSQRGKIKKDRLKAGRLKGKQRNKVLD